MGKDVFITDERLAFSRLLNTKLLNAGYKVILTSETGNDKTLQWNRNTPFALQQLNLQLKNKEMTVDNAVIIFDANEFNKMYASNTLIAIDRTCTELVTAYANLALILQTIMIKQEDGRLIFILRTSDNESIENFAINMAAVAFAKLAENTALLLSGKKLPAVQSLLVKLESPDDTSAAWVISQLGSSVLTRNAGKWVKAGQRGLFAK